MHLTKRVTKAVTPEVLADITRLTTIFRTTRDTYGASGAYLFGRYTIADAMFTPVATRFRTYAIRTDPVSEAYAAALLEHPAMQEWERRARQEVAPTAG